MKIAILIHGGVDRSGVERVIPAIVWLLERLGRRNEIHVYSFNQECEPAEWDVVGVHVHNVGSASGWRRRLFTGVATEHRVSPFQCIHAFFGWGGTYGVLLGRRHRIPVLFHLAGGEPVGLAEVNFGMRLRLRGRLQLRLAMSGATRISVATLYMQRLAAQLGARASLVPLGVALDRWPASVPRSRDITIPAFLLHVGDIRPVKDHAMLLAAATQLRENRIEFELHMAGADTMDGALQRSAAASGLGDAIHWYGVLGREDLRTLMNRADLLLVSSRHEAGPLVVLEAAVAGVPAVGTAVGHVADWAPCAAVAVPTGDSAALARETAALLADEPRRLAIARMAQRRALEIDADFTAAEFERLYGAMVSPRIPGPKLDHQAAPSKHP